MQWKRNAKKTKRRAKTRCINRRMAEMGRTDSLRLS
nr:MAG TPA: hypothetical protein [Caudoviricetes sp.]